MMSMPSRSSAARLLATAVLLVALVPTVSAVVPEGGAVVADFFVDVDVADLDLAPCPNGAFEVDAANQALVWHETDGNLPTPQGQEPGYFATGCGTASVTLAVPLGADHLHLRFDADRTVTEFDVSGSPVPINSGVNFVQRYQVANETGVIRFDAPIFEADEPSAPRATFALEEPGVPLAGQEQVTIAWTFQDASELQGLQGLPQGEAYRAVLYAPQVEFSGVPLGFTSVATRSVQGASLVDGRALRIEVPDALANSDLRIELPNVFDFREAIAPDGTVLGESTTRRAAGPNGFDRTHVLQEHVHSITYGSVISRITISSDLVREHGAGSWSVSVASSEARAVQVPLVGLALLIHLLPLPIALWADRDLRAFQREAFGGYRRTAQRMRLTLVAVGLYYLVFTLVAFLTGRLEQMAVFPPTGDGLLLYVHIGLAVFAFLTILFTARELYGMTVPKKPEGKA